MGENDLLADPALLDPRPDLALTLHVLDAARQIGLETGSSQPRPGMVETMLRRLEPAERAALSLRWAVHVRDAGGVTQALALARGVCGRERPVKSPACAQALLDMDGTLRSSEPDLVVGFREELGITQASLCAHRDLNEHDAFDLGMCRGTPISVPESRMFAEQARSDGRYLTEPRVLSQLAAAAAAGGSVPKEVRDLVSEAAGRSTVNGLYVEEIDRYGTVMTSWAILHLAGEDGKNLPERFIKALRASDVSRPDRVLILRAALDQLGQGDVPTVPGPVRLTDPDGPYNPFVALAARKSGDAGWVELGFGLDDARGTPEVLASFAITQRLISGEPAAVAQGDRETLRRALADADASVRLRLLYAAGLLATGLDAEVDPLPGGCCGGFSWLVSHDGVVCDLRGSMLLSIYQDLKEKTL